MNTSELPQPRSVEAHWLAAMADELHRLTLAVERIDRRLRDSEAPNADDEDKIDLKG